MTTTQIIYTFIIAGVIYAFSVLLLSRILRGLKKRWFVVSGILLLLPSLYIGFGLHAMHNKHFILAGVQWGLFGGALYAFNTVRLTTKGNNA
jgi:hypothetical protein